MDELQRLMAERACERLVMEYGLAVNDWDIDAFVGCFHPDAVWQRPGVPALNGHPEIRAFMESQSTNRTLRHVNGLCMVTVLDATTATARSQTTVYDVPGDGPLPAALPGPDMVVEYSDRIERRGGDWRLARRDTTVVFSIAAGRG